MLTEPFTIDEVKSVPLNVLLAQVFPENRLLVKDSGLWLIYEGDDPEDDVAYAQDHDETFADFITRAIHDLLWQEVGTDSEADGIGLDFVIAKCNPNMEAV